MSTPECCYMATKKQKSKVKRTGEQVAFAKQLLLAMVARPNVASSQYVDVYTYNARGALEYSDAFFKALDK